MKISKLVLALGMAGVLVGAANAAPKTDNQVSKKITLTAQINDGIFVSKPDGSTWYSTEELEAEDYTQKKFNKTLPIRIWSKNTDFKVQLGAPLKMSNGQLEMINQKVMLSSKAGDVEVKFGAEQVVKQSNKVGDNYDELHNLKIHAETPEGASNGSYSGDLVLLLEAVAASGEQKPEA